MKVAASYADVIKDWEALELAMQDNAANLPADMESRRAVFVAHVAKVKELKARQDSLTAARQETTQQLNKLIAEGVEMARGLRTQVRASLGAKNERLVQFGVAPLRKRAPRKPKAKTPEPQAPPSPVTKPSAA